MVAVDFRLANAAGRSITGQAVCIDFQGTVDGAEPYDAAGIRVQVADVAMAIEHAIFNVDRVCGSARVGRLPRVGGSPRKDQFIAAATAHNVATVDETIGSGIHEVSAIGGAGVLDVGNAQPLAPPAEKTVVGRPFG